MIKIYCDGSAHPNPGRGGAGVIAYSGDEEIFKISKYLGDNCTNNYAEYTALILALEAAISHNLSEIEVYLDSNLVVQQCNNYWKVKEPSLKPLHDRVRVLKFAFDKISIDWIPREKNCVADKLSKLL